MADIDWSDIEDAILAWVKGASGLADGQVIFANQSGTQPQNTYATVRLSTIRRVGAYDDEEWVTNLANPAGQEIELTSNGIRELLVRVQVFAASDIGDSNPIGILSKVASKVWLSLYLDALEAVGLSPFDVGQVEDLTDVAGSDFEGRASLEVRFYLPETVVEKVGYIASVEITNEATDPDSTFTVPE